MYQETAVWYEGCLLLLVVWSKGEHHMQQLKGKDTSDVSLNKALNLSHFTLVRTERTLWNAKDSFLTWMTVWMWITCLCKGNLRLGFNYWEVMTPYDYYKLGLVLSLALLQELFSFSYYFSSFLFFVLYFCCRKQWTFIRWPMRIH